MSGVTERAGAIVSNNTSILVLTIVFPSLSSAYRLTSLTPSATDNG